MHQARVEGPKADFQYFYIITKTFCIVRLLILPRACKAACMDAISEETSMSREMTNKGMWLVELFIFYIINGESFWIIFICFVIQDK